jgi:hypothetical protein
MDQRDATKFGTTSTSGLLLWRHTLTPALAWLAIAAASVGPLSPTSARGQQETTHQRAVLASVPHLTLGSTNGAAGSQVTVRVSLTSNGTNVVTIAPLRFSVDPSLLTFGMCTKAVGVSAGKAVNSAVPAAGQVSVALSGDLVAIPDGEIIDCTFTIAAGAANGVIAVTFQSAALADDQFNDYDATGSSGSVTVGDGMSSTPTTTPEATLTPTPTNTPKPCLGDCDRQGEVTVNELITMVNIALGNAGASMCTAGDANGDGEITINEIVAGVNNALNGCPTG